MRKDNGELRFQWLIASLDVSRGFNEDNAGAELDGVWEWRVSLLGLLNALANTPESLEERCTLRGELDRRGLAGAIEVSRVRAEC